MPADEAVVRLGVLLTGSEAADIAERLSDGDTRTTALRAVPDNRRSSVRELMERAGLMTGTPATAIAVLRAIQGAHSAVTRADPVWTMPGHIARSGALTSSVARLVEGARLSVTCSTFNFQRSSVLWSSLGELARRPNIAIRVYVDGRAAEGGLGSSPTTAEIAAALHPAVVHCTTSFDGSYVRNHAKFLAVDHRFMLVTSANFSWSAEYGNVEFGVIIDDAALVASVEREMRDAEDVLYERIPNK